MPLPRARVGEVSGGARRDFAHQREVIAVGIGEFRQPQFGIRRAMNYVRVGDESNPSTSELRVRALDVGYAKIDRCAPHGRFSGRRHPDEQTDSAAQEKSHLWRRREQERQAEDISIKRYATFEFVYRDQ